MLLFLEIAFWVSISEHEHSEELFWGFLAVWFTKELYLSPDLEDNIDSTFCIHIKKKI